MVAPSVFAFATAGEMVLMSITMVPRWIALKTPFGPSSTSATSGESGTIVMIRVALFATSAGDAARSAPASTTSSTGPWLRLCATTGKPAFNRFFAMGRPISPSPMNPTVSAMSLLSVPRILADSYSKEANAK
jgi:hypothetical protein